MSKKNRNANSVSRQTKPQEAKPSNSTIQIQHHQEMSGPLPPPSMLEHYDRISPGLADRIVRMAEEEATHRRKEESRALDADIENLKSSNRETMGGQLSALIIAVVTVVAGSVTAINGAEMAGGFIGTGGVASLVAVFIYGRSRKHK